MIVAPVTEPMHMPSRSLSDTCRDSAAPSLAPEVPKTRKRTRKDTKKKKKKVGKKRTKARKKKRTKKAAKNEQKRHETTAEFRGTCGKRQDRPSPFKVQPEALLLHLVRSHHIHHLVLPQEPLHCTISKHEAAAANLYVRSVLCHSRLTKGQERTSQVHR